jgi:DNA primase
MDTAHVDLLGLLQADTTLKRVSSHSGGEYAGPCPWCGGNDRFRVWPHDDTPHYWCRQCGRDGDAITYLRERDGLSFAEACRQLELPLDTLQRPRSEGAVSLRPRLGLVRNDWPALTDDAWQRAAHAFVRHSFDVLHSPKGHRALDYLHHQRGLTDRVIDQFGLGFNPTDQYQRWGQLDVFLPVGIVIPWSEEQDIWSDTTRLWAVNIRRRPNHKPKYWKAKGSANGLYGAAYLKPGATVVMVEGEFCALSIHVAVPDLFIPVATGSTTGSHHFRWLSRLSLANRIILAFDDDENGAGDTASGWWQDAFPHKTVRLVPTRHDVNDMLTAGDDILAWLNEALSSPEGGP